eukprot:887331-Amorphochlora_amoeboformis.AAC.1
MVVSARTSAPAPAGCVLVKTSFEKKRGRTGQKRGRTCLESILRRLPYINPKENDIPPVVPNARA